MPTDQIFQTKSTGSNHLNVDSQGLLPHGMAPFTIKPLDGHKFFHENNKEGRPRVYLVVTIDTEEDQWGPGSGNVTVKNMSCIPRLQSLFDGYGILPTYLVSLPVAANDEAIKTLNSILDDGHCEIGSHLHPWNTPPIREEITNTSTMLSNLPYELQVEKLAHLTDFLEHRTGQRPRSFRAGRWGLNNETFRALIAYGYAVDSSVTPFVSWKAYRGPAFDEMPFVPFLMREARKDAGNNGYGSLVEVPATIGYNRWPFRRCRQLEKKLHRLPSRFHAKGLAAKSNILRKIWLSPEIDSAINMIALSRLLIKHGIRVLNVTFHSSSLMPGLTPFVTSGNALEKFYKRLTDYFDGLYRLAEVKPMVLSAMAGFIRERLGADPAEDKLMKTSCDHDHSVGGV